MKSSLIVILLVALTILGCGKSSDPNEKTEAQVLEEGYKVLSGSEITQYFTGNTLKGRVRGKNYVLYFIDSSNNVSITGEQTDTGTWSVKGDQFCQTWMNWRDGKTHCGRVAKKGEHIYWLRDGVVVGETTLYLGNTEGF